MATGNGILTTTKGQEEQNILISEREIFDLCGPLHLTAIDWENVAHRRSVAASLVQGVYILERDRQEKRQEAQAFAPPWWQYFQFQLYRVLVDDADSCIFGAIYKFTPSKSYAGDSKDKSPQFAIAFRGTLTKEYIGYFQHRDRMDTMGAGVIEKVATQHSIGGLVMNFMGKECDEPLHLIPSANLTVNLSPSTDFKEAHGIHQWWKPDLLVESKKHQFN